VKIAAFYENIYDGVQATGRQMKDVLAELHDVGMDLLYLNPESWKRDRNELSEIIGKLGVKIEGMHAFCDFSGEPDTLKYKEITDIAVEAGAGNLLLIPGMFSSGNTYRDLTNMIIGMRRAIEYGQARNLPILMEDFDGALAPYNCIAGLQYFMDTVDGLECAFDTGNFAMFRENELEAFDLFADKIRTVHLKDRANERRHDGDTPFFCADGNPVYACSIGKGYIHIAEILKKLKQNDYRGNVIVELYACDPKYVLEDAAASITWVKAQLQTYQVKHQIQI